MIVHKHIMLVQKHAFKNRLQNQNNISKIKTIHTQIHPSTYERYQLWIVPLIFLQNVIRISDGSQISHHEICTQFYLPDQVCHRH